MGRHGSKSNRTVGGLRILRMGIYSDGTAGNGWGKNRSCRNALTIVRRWCSSRKKKDEWKGICDHRPKPVRQSKRRIMERVNEATYRLQWARSWEDWRGQRPFRGHSTWCDSSRRQRRRCCPSATAQPPLVIVRIKIWANTIVEMST
jgi:hypothetical protein